MVKAAVRKERVLGCHRRSFYEYPLREQPELEAGHIFGEDATAGRYRVSEEECHAYPKDDLFHNPYGLWRLTLQEMGGGAMSQLGFPLL